MEMLQNMLSMYEKKANYLLCSTEQTQTGLEQLEGEKMMAEF